jgi:hypothetical protein
MKSAKLRQMAMADHEGKAKSAQQIAVATLAAASVVFHMIPS